MRGNTTKGAKDMSKVEDTSKRPAEVHLAGLIGEGQTEYITGMESAGQRQLVASSLLPIEVYPNDAAFEALGFTFGEAKDDLFREATLPEGWRKEGSDHAMHSKVVDERGMERVGVFYKAAFYDRKADMTLINVGGGVARKFLYSDEDNPIPWDLLTDAERADAIGGLRQMVKDAADPVTGHIYADRGKKAEAELERIGA